MKRIIKIATACLLVSLVLCISLSCKRPSSDNPSDSAQSTQSECVSEGTQEDTVPEVVQFVPHEAYTVVYGNLYADQTPVRDAVEKICTLFSQVYGLETHMARDTDEPNAYEILIGDTSRPQSRELQKGLGLEDYAYFVESEQVIVIVGGSPSATRAGVERFCEDQLNGESPALTAGTSYTYRAAYSYSAATLNGIPLSDYTVAVSSVSDVSHALALVSELGRFTGEGMPIRFCEELNGNEKGVIAFGASSRSETGRLIGSMYRFRFYSDAIGTVFCINASNNPMYESALQEFFARIELSENDSEITMRIKAEEKTYYAFEDSISDWTELSRKETVLAEGALYQEILFCDESRLAYRAYVLLLDPSKFTLYMGTANDGYSYGLTDSTVQTVKEQMQARLDKGYEVLAGVNADFFASGDYHPCGLAIKEGVKISQPNNRPFLGIRTDGGVVISNASGYSSSLQLRTAVGGSDVIVKDGMPFSIGTAPAYGDIHPRTLAGVTADGTIILVVIDGRQPAYSNGATLAHCARLMIDLGASYAINLDGGGSSTMILHDSQSGELETVNKPSDGTLRKVYNSLLVVPVTE